MQPWMELRECNYLIAGVDNDVGAAKEVGDGAGVGMEETLPRDGYTVTTPVDLHELRKLALMRRSVYEVP